MNCELHCSWARRSFHGQTLRVVLGWSCLHLRHKSIGEWGHHRLFPTTGKVSTNGRPGRGHILLSQRFHHIKRERILRNICFGLSGSLEWSCQLVPLLSAKALEAYTSMDEDIAYCYKDLKDALLSSTYWQRLTDGSSERVKEKALPRPIIA